jgi:TRAP-type mannitol/chloroaromatic compound transport system permease small subunit
VQALLRVSRLIDRLMAGIGKLISVIVIVLILLGVFNVLTRYLGQFVGRNLYSQGAAEAQNYLFSLIFFLGFAYILQRNENVRVDFLYANWSERRRALVNLLGNLLFLIPFCIIGLVMAYPSVRRSWQQGETSGNAGGLPIYPLKAMLLVAFSLLLLQAISEIIKHIAVLRGVQTPALQAAEASRAEPVE